MQAVTSQSMRDIENAVFAKGHSPEALMDQAGKRIAKSILRYYPTRKNVTAYLGKGHNAGDALVALAHLKEAGWEISIQTKLLQRDLTPLTQKKLLALGGNLLKSKQRPRQHSVLIDGLVGIGSRGPLKSPLVESAIEMNNLRNFHGCSTVAVDAPSGVNADTGEIYENAVIADLTISIGYPKIGLLNSNSISHVGAIAHIALDHLTLLDQPTQSHKHLITHQSLYLKKREFDTHKGQVGRVGIWAGSEGMLGAAALAATAAIKSGAGLVTVFIPPTLYPILATMVPHEVMVKPAIDPTLLLEQKFDALVIGPGIGKPVASLREKLFKVIEEASCPLVLDADMLNVLSEDNQQHLIHSGCILTPHPGEMSRLYGSTTEQDRETTVRAFTEQHSGTLVYKGARSIVGASGSPLFINASGSPAMATAGQGDVLAGIIGGLCAQGYPNIEAAKLAIWLAGESAQLALADGSHTEETLTATTTIGYLAKAFQAMIRRA